MVGAPAAPATGARAHVPLTASLPDGGRFVALDSLRGLAALSVAAFHFQGTGPLFSNDFVLGAGLAVDFFFVLSGFVIAASYGGRLADGFPIRRFALLRIGRLYPLHLAMLLAFLLSEFLLVASGLPTGTAREPFTGGHSPGNLATAIALLNGLQVPIGNDWNGPSWSISVEIWLYLAIALVWRAFGRRGWIVAGIAAAAAGTALTLGLADHVAPFSSRALRGVLGFGLGVCVWEMWRHGIRLCAGRGMATLIEIGLLAAAIIIFATKDSFPGHNVLADLAFALTVLVFAGELGLVSRLLAFRPFVWLGILSYSIYMVHGLVGGRVKDMARVAGMDTGSDLLGLFHFFVVIAAAYIAWRLIEEPCRLWSRRRAARMGAGCEEDAAPTF